MENCAIDVSQQSDFIFIGLKTINIIIIGFQ